MDGLKTVFDPESGLILAEVLIKLGIGALLGGAIGYERERSGRAAGIRTHMLLVIGVVLFSEVSKGFGGGDSSRIAAQIVTGVGFLGAGTILRFGVEIKGLTSAASLWAAAAIGMAVSTGGGFVLVAIVGTGMTLLTLSYLTILEKKLAPFSHMMTLQIELDHRSRLPDVIDQIQKAGGKTKGMRVVGTSPHLHMQIDLDGDQDKVMQAVAVVEGVQSTRWSD